MGFGSFKAGVHQPLPHALTLAIGRHGHSIDLGEFAGLYVQGCATHKPAGRVANNDEVCNRSCNSPGRLLIQPWIVTIESDYVRNRLRVVTPCCADFVLIAHARPSRQPSIIPPPSSRNPSAARAPAENRRRACKRRSDSRRGRSRGLRFRKSCNPRYRRAS